MDETVREVGAELLAVTAVDFGRDTALVEFACCLGKWHWLAGSTSKAFVFKVSAGTLFPSVKSPAKAGRKGRPCRPVA